MNKSVTSPLVIAVAQQFVILLRKINRQWEKGYFRFRKDDSVVEANGSYCVGSDVELINSVKYSVYLVDLRNKGEELLQAMGSENGVFVLVVTSSLDYEIKFEYENMDRWRITLLDNGTGLPKDF